MLEKVDLTADVKSEAYDELLPRLSLELRRLQWEARQAGLPVILILEGFEAAGMDDSVQVLMEALDPRHVKVHPIYPPLEEERLRPFLWRFWLRTPAQGEIAVFHRSWYRRVLEERLETGTPKDKWAQAYREINEFERQLANDGTLIVKLWFHISRKEQRKRFQKFEQNPFEHWRIDKADWRQNKRYDDYIQAAEQMLESTSTAEAPWDIVPANHRSYRRIKSLETLIRKIGDALHTRRNLPPPPSGKPEVVTPASEVLARIPGILDRVDLEQKLLPETYAPLLRSSQVRLRELEFACYEHRLPVVAVFEGWDAAGKGGIIKRLVINLDPRGYDVNPVAAPIGEEKTHHYLWRFWRRFPKAGHFAIFDRSWYGRVMVERVEGFCTEAEWKKAYREINEFERQLVDYGTVMRKFWLHIDKDEQARRFEARQNDPFKNYKLTEEDWRNREKWDLYRSAVAEMLERTSTTYAPWTIVEANDKYFARVKVIETLCGAIEKGLKEVKAKK